MTVRWQNVSLPFVGGVDTKSDSLALQAPKLAAVENAAFDKRASIRKRNGYTRLPQLQSNGTTDISAAQALFTRGNELLLADGEALWSYAESQERWYSKGAYAPLSITTGDVCERQSNQIAPDYAEAAGVGVGVYAWEDSRGGSRYSIIDTATGEYLYVDQVLGTDAKCIRCITIDGFIHILYIDDSEGALRDKIIKPLDLATSVAAASEELVTDIREANACYDVQVYGASARLAYVTTTANTVHVCTLSKSGTAGTSVAFEITDGASPVSPTSLALGIAYAPMEDRMLLVCGTGVGFYWVHMSPLYTPGLGFVSAGGGAKTLASVIRVAVSSSIYATGIGADWEDEGDALMSVWVETTGASTRDNIVRIYPWSMHADTVGTVASTIHHAVLASGGFVSGRYGYAVLSYVDTVQPTYFLYRHDGKLCGRMLSGEAGGPPRSTLGPTLCTNPKATADGFAWVGTSRKRLETVPTVNASGTVTGLNVSRTDYSIERIDLDFSVYTSAAEIEGTLYLTGGLLQQYDGATIVESGFAVYPESMTATPSSMAVPAAMTASAVYAYRWYYEWPTVSGARERSAALPLVVTMGVSEEGVTHVLPTLSHTGKPDVSLVGYRTQANPTFDSAFYRITDVDPSTTGAAANGYVANSLSAATVTFIDYMADTAIVSKEIDYQSSGELENIMPPPPSIIAQGKNRLFTAGDDMRTVHVSKLVNPGSLAAFNDALPITVDSTGGPITGLAALAEALVIFKRDRIYLAAQGDGPNNLGFGAFTPPQLVSSDLGCADARSIVLTPDGLMFQSAKGIRLLADGPQGLQVVDVGQDVEAYRAQSITSATVVNDRSQVRFLTDDGMTLLYDYQFQQWSTWTNHEGVAAVLWKGETYAYAKASGRVLVEGAEVYSDDGVEVRRVVETAWIEFQGLQGYQSVRRFAILGHYKSPHRLRVTVYKNFESRASYSFEWDPNGVLAIDPYGAGEYGAGPYGGSGSTVYQCRHHVRGSLKMSAIKIRIEDIPGLPPGESSVLTELMLEMGMRPGTSRTTSGKDV